MKKALFLILLSGTLFGCVAHVTPEGTYLEPLPTHIVVGPPVVVAPPPHVVVNPLPSVVVVPDRHIYFYGGMYYNYWDGIWYYGKRDKGPWHKLQKKYYPKRYKRHKARRKHDRY
jgi:hypothetical protein